MTAISKVSATEKAGTIRALHARFEAAFVEYNAVDHAILDLDESQHDQIMESRLKDAQKTNAAETDALRLAILYQVPDDWVEAMILQYHIYVTSDLVANGEDIAAESSALQVAISTLLDFMCCEVDQDHAELGEQFRSAAEMVFYRRRHRTGVVEA